jgi:tripartite-type tricarboxylate transporter receptor subunit TctC
MTVAHLGTPLLRIAYKDGGPDNTPPPIVAQLNEAMNKALADPAVFKRLQEVGIDPTPGSTPERTASFIKAELAKWAPMIKASGAQIE